MKFQNTQVLGFEGAFRGLRNPMNSWAKSDSQFGIALIEDLDYDSDMVDLWCQANGFDPMEVSTDQWDKYANWLMENGILYNKDGCVQYAFIGPKDMDLAHRMIKAGSSDRKFLRQIFVSVNITAPIYWYKEFDTYKIGTVANSTSTMHKLSSTPIELNCFEMGDFNNLRVYNEEPYNYDSFTIDIWNNIIDACETLRQRYNETKDQRYWKELIRILPQGWMQTRTWTANYQILRNMYVQRRHHRLIQWEHFCNWVESLPYSSDLILYGLDNK